MKRNFCKAKGVSAIKVFLDKAISELGNLYTSLELRKFESAINLILESERRGGRVHVTGIGKPTYVAGYGAAILSSTGTPAAFLDASEVSHGSAGQVKRGDVVIAISNSGKTIELLNAIDIVKKCGVYIIGISGNPLSPLAKKSDVFISVGVKCEGDPLNLPPRISVIAQTLTLAALSVGLQVQKGLTMKKYHSLHQGGAIGKASKKPKK